MSNMIVMGRIVAPYGIYGWVKVQVSTESIDSLYDYPEWWIGREDNSTQPGIKNSPWQKYKVEHLKIHNDVLIAKLKGVDDRDAAFALKSKHVAVPREALPVPDEGEYYWTDLIGLNVTNQQNVPLGVIADVFETGANDVIVVKDPKDGKERLLPFVDQAILEVDLAQKTMLVDWPIEWDE